MSHVVAIEAEIKDIDALEAACTRLGFELVRGQKTYTWWGRWEDDYSEADAAYKQGIPVEDYGKNAEHVIRVPGARYEVGVHRHPTKPGQFMLVWDYIHEPLRKALDGEHATKRNGGGRLLQAYGVEAAKRSLTRLGYRPREVAGPNGSIKVVAVGR